MICIVGGKIMCIGEIFFCVYIDIVMFYII